MERMITARSRWMAGAAVAVVSLLAGFFIPISTTVAMAPADCSRCETWGDMMGSQEDPTKLCQFDSVEGGTGCEGNCEDVPGPGIKCSCRVFGECKWIKVT
jgi:hypothetical protein